MKKFLSGLKKGALHKELGVSKGKKIPTSKLVIKKGMSPLEKKRINFAKNAKKWNHGATQSNPHMSASRTKGYDFKKAEKKLGVLRQGLHMQSSTV